MRVFLLSLLAVAVLLAGPARADDDAGAPWSAVNNGLQARLSFARKGTILGTPVIVTYLELRNVSDNTDAMDIPLDLHKVEFTVTDSSGKTIDPSDSPYDGGGIQLGTIHLPYDSYLRYNITCLGAGVPKDQAAILDLGPGHNWVFNRGDANTYYLQAKFTIEQPKDRRWSGTIEIPKVKIPTVAE